MPFSFRPRTFSFPVRPFVPDVVISLPDAAEVVVEGVVPAIQVGVTLAIPVAEVVVEAVVPTLSIGVTVNLPAPADVTAEALVPEVFTGLGVDVTVGTLHYLGSKLTLEPI